jgi:hypothetical protein
MLIFIEYESLSGYFCNTSFVQLNLLFLLLDKAVLLQTFQKKGTLCYFFPF